MKILGIETSCDETALALIETRDNDQTGATEIKILGTELISQIELHKKYGGVYPNLAKREHAKNLVPLCIKLLEKDPTSEVTKNPDSTQTDTQKPDLKLIELKEILKKEPELYENLIKNFEKFPKKDIDAVAVTSGPGLEPALWVGINFAKALGKIWNVPVYPINHMEGHIMSCLIDEKSTDDFHPLHDISYPAIALLISGGHTEIIYIKEPRKYELVGQTRDDAIGEAFDKVARILGLPYPGGPEISKLAEAHRQKYPEPYQKVFNLPRPMINSTDLDFSCAGLKTAVLYASQKIPNILDEKEKVETMAREFEDAILDVIDKKLRKTLEKFETKTILVGGGVIANKAIREKIKKLGIEYKIPTFFPAINLSTDNALMIALACFKSLKEVSGISKTLEISADGNKKLHNTQ